MAAQLNHTIVWCRDQRRSSQFLAEMLGRPAPRKFSHFDVVELDNRVSLDFAERSGVITPQHYAFLIGEDDFDAVLPVSIKRSWSTGQTRCGRGPARSTATTAAAASTSPIRTAITLEVLTPRPRESVANLRRFI